MVNDYFRGATLETCLSEELLTSLELVNSDKANLEVEGAVSIVFEKWELVVSITR